MSREIFKEEKLILNLKKSKMQIFKKGGRRAKQEKWNWKGQEVEVVKCFKYLGYMMQSNNGNSERIKYICKKARMGMGAVWGIGERLFKNEVGKRLKLFNAITEAILMYGVEVWGWREEAELQKLLTKYWRWMLGVRWNTPTYLIQEEVKEDIMWSRTWWRAYSYTRNVLASEEDSWRRACARWRVEEARKKGRWREMREKEWCKIGLSEEGCDDLVVRGRDIRVEINERKDT